MIVFLLTAAIYRLTRLVTRDAFPPVAAIRTRISKRFGEDSWQSYLAECPWCMSVWIAAAATALACRYVNIPAPWLTWLAASAITGLVSSLEPK